jgi:hypothetical protein
MHDQLYAVDHSYGICHISEEEIAKCEHGSPVLVNLQCGLFWAPDDVKGHCDFSSFDSDEHIAALQSTQAEKRKAKQLEKDQQDEKDREAFRLLEERVSKEKSELVIEGKRRRTE